VISWEGVVHCWRCIKSYSHVSIQIECFFLELSTHGHISTQIQGNIIHPRNLNYSLHAVSVYAGVLHYETVCHTSSLLVSGTHMCWMCTEQDPEYVGLSDDE
jgi:hypothetical protein